LTFNLKERTILVVEVQKKTALDRRESSEYTIPHGDLTEGRRMDYEAQAKKRLAFYLDVADIMSSQFYDRQLTESLFAGDPIWAMQRAGIDIDRTSMDMQRTQE
jgi:hypothetical protein